MQFHVYSDHAASDPTDPQDLAAVRKHRSRNLTTHLFVRDPQPASLATVLETFLTDVEDVRERDKAMRAISAAASGSADSVHLGDNDNHLISPIDHGRHVILGHDRVFRRYYADDVPDYVPFSGSDIEARLLARPIAFLVTPDMDGTRYTLIEGIVPGASTVLDEQIALNTYGLLEAFVENGVLVDEITAAIGEGWQEDLEAARHRFTMLAG